MYTIYVAFLIFFYIYSNNKNDEDSIVSKLFDIITLLKAKITIYCDAYRYPDIKLQFTKN